MSKSETIFSNFTTEELLALEGRISDIDLQVGCPNACLGCGEDAPKKQTRMPWELYQAIVEGIDQIITGDNISLLNKEGIFLSRDGDPVNYRVFENDGIERTLASAVDLLRRTMPEQKLHITTAGWKFGDTYQQRAMEEVVRVVQDSKAKVGLTYSIKTTSLLVRKEYDRFLEKIFGDLVNITDRNLKKVFPRYNRGRAVLFRKKYKRDFERNGIDFHKYQKHFDLSEWEWLLKRHTARFLRGSKYVSRVINNMKTLKDVEVGWGVQYVCENGKGDFLPPDYRKYKYLFSKETVQKIADHCFSQAGYRPSISGPIGDGNLHYSNGKNVCGIENRKFTGVGRAPEDFGIFRKILFKSVYQDTIWANIRPTGALNVWVAGTGYDMSRIELSPEIFEKYNWIYDEGKKQSLSLLPGLQGRTLG